MVLVLLPGGTFLMGAQRTDPKGPNYDPGAASNESPVHEVTLSSFFLSKYEMTQGQWQRIMGENPSYWNEQDSEPWIGANALVHPVESVSWHDCTEALMRVGLLLPTEAQWEYGARGATDTPCWTGSKRQSLKGAANLADASDSRTFSEKFSEEWLDDGFGLHAPVGSFRCNAFGLHDVAGNVWEWCRDLFAGYELEVAEKDELQKDLAQDGPPNRVNRGGGFDNPAVYARSAFRGRILPEDRSYSLGVRAARALP
jgi:formylglycine-generating enzyme required for sulfatase activity